MTANADRFTTILLAEKRAHHNSERNGTQKGMEIPTEADAAVAVRALSKALWFNAARNPVVSRACEKAGAPKDDAGLAAWLGA